MKIMTNVARAVSVVGACFFFSGSMLNAAKPEMKGLEPYQIVDITETSVVPANNKAASDSTTPTAAAKKKSTQPAKGIVYLPIVSLSSYFPIVAQILMMILVIAFSGIFGAWLMFRELAKRVQVLQDATPVVATTPQAVESFVMTETSVPAAQQQAVSLATVKKRTLFVSQKSTSDTDQQNLLKQQFVDQSNQLEYSPPKTQAKGPIAKKQSEDSKSNRMPKNFLINEWFPIER